jgi:tetratricopeptide (TPR) repeat protein
MDQLEMARLERDPPTKRYDDSPLFDQALALFQAGRLADAEEIIRRLLQRDPEHFRALHLLGIVLSQQGNHGEGLQAIDAALKIDAQSAAACNSRGNVLVALKRYDEALASFEKSIALDPNSPIAFGNRGNVYRELGRFDEAVASYDTAIALDSDDAEAFYNRGCALQELKLFDEAAASYDKAIALKSDYAEAFCNRGAALQALGRLSDALASYDRAIALNPNLPEALCSRGTAFQKMRRFDEAIASYDQAIAAKPDFAEALFNRGVVLDELKRFEEALASRGNAKATSDVGFMLDYDAMHVAISELRKKQIFFIGGTPKSGTTWLQFLLDAHPEVSCKGEAHFAELGPIVRSALDEHNQYITWKNETIFKGLEGYPRLGDDDFHYLLATWISLLLVRHSKRKDVRAVGEKSPNNLQIFDVLDSLFPAAKFIHIVRDGRDCAVSGWFHNLRVTPDWTKQTFSSMDAYLMSYADDWAKELAIAQTFADRYQGRFRQIRYEDLARTTERVLAEIFAFLNVDTAEAVLANCRSEASFTKLSGGRAAGVENRESFFRKGVTGDWQNHFTKELEDGFRKRAGRWLEQFGYTS